MIIYSVYEELRLIVYLFCFGIFILFLYDILLAFINHKKKIVQYIYKIIFSLSIIYISYLFAFSLKKGYMPNYSCLLVFIGMLFYIKLFHFKMHHMLCMIFEKINCFFKQLLRPFNIFRKTFKGLKEKILKKNIKTLYK